MSAVSIEEFNSWSEEQKQAYREAENARLDALLLEQEAEDAELAGSPWFEAPVKTIPAFTFGELLKDKTPIPQDIIYPRVLTPSGMLVFGGAPKVGKSDFLLSWLAHMAAGLPFMGMYPPHPLKIFYLQAEVQYHYLRERVKAIDINRDCLSIVEENLIITPQIRMLLDKDGVETIGNTIKQHFVPDIIVIDPIANVYDQESENDNAQMMTFLSQRVEALRDYAKPETSFMLVHHTKKIAKDELIKDPFQMFSGASSIRRYYTTGMVMYRPDEDVSECVLTSELRNGAKLPNIHVDKIEGRWCKVQETQTRIGDERNRRVNVLISALAESDERHTINSFSNFMANKNGLGSYKSVSRLLNEMAAQEDGVCLIRDQNNKMVLRLL